MNVTIESATLEKFSAFTKKTDLTVYGQYTFKTTEEGSPTLLGQFSNNTYLAKLSQMANNDTWTKVCVPMDAEVTVKFDGATFDGILSELSVKRNLEKQKTSYSFTVEKEVEKIVTRDTVSHLENSWAKSDAVVSDGFLSHSLESIPQIVKD